MIQGRNPIGAARKQRGGFSDLLPVSELPRTVPCYNWGLRAEDSSLLDTSRDRPEYQHLTDAALVGGKKGQATCLLRPSHVVRDGCTVRSEWPNMPFVCTQLDELFLVIRSIPSARFRLSGRCYEVQTDNPPRVWYTMPLHVAEAGKELVLEIFSGKYKWACKFDVVPDQSSILTRWTLSTRLVSVG